MGNPVVHFEVAGSDGAKLQDFYRDLFDWQINTDNPMSYGIVDNGGEGINGGIAESPNGPHLTWYVQVPSIDDTLQKAEAKGATTVMPRTEMEMVTFALFKDPEGNVVGLVEGA
jgi:predicted enzyme related to lactoylglutathione lyase